MIGSTLEASRRLAASLLVLLLAGGAVACGGDDDGATPDAGISLDDASVPDAGSGGAGTCDAPTLVEGIEGVVTVSFDTTDSPAGALDLGEFCSNPDVDPLPPQEVIAYTVPGTGPHAINFTTAIPETLTNFDTLVQVRTSCGEIPEAGFPPTCFDETSATDPRSTGVVMADGGTVLYFIVTGYGDLDAVDEIDRGPAGLEISARPNQTPVITGGDLRAIGIRTEIEASGTDADGDAAGLSATFLGVDGSPVDLNDDGTVADTLLTYFDAPVGGAESFTGVSTLFAIAVAGGGVRLNDQLRRHGVVSARLRVFDEAFALSVDEVTVPLRAIAEVGFGAVCDEDHACVLGLRCSTAGACEAEPAVAAACGAATALDIPIPTDTTTSVVRTGTITGEHGFTEGSCAHSPSIERIFDLEVPDMPVDLIASTDHAGTGSTDTVLYMRSICADLSSELTGGCNDDLASGGANIRSRITLRDVEPGPISLFVEVFRHPPDEGAPFELSVSLRPVLATGASCDPAQVDNRCAVSACPPATSVCP